MTQDSLLLVSDTEYGQLGEPSHMETVGSGKKISKPLHIRDRNTGTVFLIDTGSDLSLLPVRRKIKKQPIEDILFAANDSRISTFDQELLVS